MAYTNVGFKYGLQSNLNTLITTQTAEPGCFYLTSDTQRLYVGKEVLDSNGQIQTHSEGANIGKIKAIPVSVNAGIQFVTNTDSLPRYTADADKDAHAGEFYYIPDSNILCVYSGSQFVQINNNTNTYLIDEQDNFVLQDNSNNHETLLTLSLLQGDASGGIPIEDTITIKGANGIQISSTSTNATVQPGDESFHKKIKELTITGDQYDLSLGGLTNKTENAPMTDINLKLDSSNSNHDSDVKLFPGSNVDFTAHATNSNIDGIAINATDTTVNSIDIAPSLNSTTNQPDNGFVVTITDTGSNQIDTVFDPTISYMNNMAGTDKPALHFIDGNLDLPIYSNNALFEFEKTLNAMTYKGTVGTTGGYATSIIYDYDAEDAAAAEQENEYYAGTWRFIKQGTALPNPKVGDVFLVTGENLTIPAATDLHINSRVCTPGTLLIAHILNYDSSITEDDYGLIPDGYLDFDIVENTNDTDTQYELVQDATNRILTLQNTVTDTPVSSVQFNGTNKINATATSETVNDATVLKFNFAHAPLGSGEGVATPTTAASQAYLTDFDITAITALTLDNYGHVTGITTKQHTVKDSNASLTSLSNTTSAANNSGTISTSASFENANGVLQEVTDGTFTLNSTTLSITKSNTGVGVAQGLDINLSWGTF